MRIYLTEMTLTKIFTVKLLVNISLLCLFPGLLVQYQKYQNPENCNEKFKALTRLSWGLLYYDDEKI